MLWVDKIKTQVLSRLKYDEEMQKLQKKYPDFTLVTLPVSSTDPTFPTLLLQQLETPEVGQDLDNVTVNGINAGFQIDVTDNTRDNRVRVEEIISAAYAVMKSMRFNVRRMPDQDTQDEKRSTLRATRIIGSGDTL